MLHFHSAPGSPQSKYRVLVVDDDPSLRNLLSNALDTDYQILQAENGEEAFQVAKKEHPDLIVLDVQMPVRDGIWACQHLRQDEETQHIPILILSSRREVHEKLEAYAVGADDYLEKPFTTAELKAKIFAKIRRLEEHRPKDVQVGNLRLSINKMELQIDDEIIPLSVLEVRLLNYFLMNVDTVLPRQEILLNVWRDVTVSGRTVDAHIVSLRRKISKFDHEIVTVYGAGYSLRKKSR